jgi:primosomal protein N'
MANEVEREGQETSRNNSSDDPNIVECIKAIAAYNARAELTTELQMTLFLKSWWSNTYNRPLKDPLLESYTLEELLYEFYDKVERQKAYEERSTKEADKMEEAKEKEVLDWAEQEEQKELEEMRRAAAAPKDPTKDPENLKWMQEQLERGKQVHGDTFGEDIDEEFGE